MFELPLFPLNSVLFPGMPLHLHIFEERYKEMMRQVMETNQTFGVVLIRKGVEAMGPLAEPFMIGATARVIQTHPLGEGRMNVVAIGQERFRALRLERDLAPYLVGHAELYPLLLDDPRSAAPVVQVLRPMMERYLQTLVRAGDLNAPEPNIPEQIIPLLHLACILLQLPQDQKQRLLEAESADWLLQRLPAIYRRELALLRAITSNGAGMIGMFSKS
jgi:Lon protease-like protein